MCADMSVYTCKSLHTLAVSTDIDLCYVLELPVVADMLPCDEVVNTH